MPPNARDSDDISQEAVASDANQETSTVNGAADIQRNIQNNNHTQEQNGIGLPQNSSASISEQPNSNLPSLRCINVSSNLPNGSEVSARLEDNNTTIYIIPTCDAPLNPCNSLSREQQTEQNSISTSIPPHLFVLPSVPHPSTLNISQPYPSYNQTAPPDYFPAPTNLVSNTLNQPRLYTVAPYGDPPPEYDSWTREPSSARETSSTSINGSQSYSHRLQQYAGNHPFQMLSYSEECRGQPISCRPTSAASTSTLCCVNDTTPSERNDNPSTGCILPTHRRNGCSECNNHFIPPGVPSHVFNSSHVFNISRNNRCGQSCHYQFPIHNDANTSIVTNEVQEEGDEEEYDRMTNTPSSPPEYLTVKRWVMVVLLILLLTTFSLLLGVSMQHFQLLKKFGSVDKSNDDRGDRTYRFHPKFGGNTNPKFTVPPKTSSTPIYLQRQTSKSKNNASNISYNEKRKRHISSPKNCNYIIDNPTRDYFNLIISKFQSSNTANSKVIEALCNRKLDWQYMGINNNTNRVDLLLKRNTRGMTHLRNVCSELRNIMHDNPPVNMNADKLLNDLKSSSQDCLPLNDDVETVSIRQNQGSGPSINCKDHSNQWKSNLGVLKNKSLPDEMLFYSLVLLANECSIIGPSKMETNTDSKDIDGITRSSKHLP